MSDRRAYPFTVTASGVVIKKDSVAAENRGVAVKLVLQRFWRKYKGRHGPASETVVVGDPYKEVRFSNTFNCSDKRNNYLDLETIERVIGESLGKLEGDTKVGSPNHPHRSLRLKKRRRKYLTMVAPNIQESNTGTYYYRIILQPQQSKAGIVTQKRKMKDIRLCAGTLAEAIEEIKRLGLRSQNKTARTLKKRSLKFVSHVAGLAPLSNDDKEFFKPVLKNAPQLRAG